MDEKFGYFRYTSDVKQLQQEKKPENEQKILGDEELVNTENFITFFCFRCLLSRRSFQTGFMQSLSLDEAISTNFVVVAVPILHSHSMVSSLRVYRDYPMVSIKNFCHRCLLYDYYYYDAAIYQMG